VQTFCPGIYPPLSTLSLSITSPSDDSASSTDTYTTSSEELAALEAEIRELEKRIDALNETIIMLNASLAELCAMVQGLNETLTQSLQEVYAYAYLRVTELSEEINRTVYLIRLVNVALEERLSELEESLSEVSSKLSQLDAQVTKLVEQLETLQKIQRAQEVMIRIISYALIALGVGMVVIAGLIVRLMRRSFLREERK